MRAMAVICLLALLGGADPAHAADAKKVVRDLKQAGKEVGHASAKLGREVGHAAADGGREIARVSTQAAHDVRRVSVAYWDRVLAGKRRRVAELEKENRELKRDRKR